MLKAAADLLTTTFAESLKKLVAPSALISAIVLVLLHIVLVHPTWTAANLPGTGLLSELDDAGRIAVVVLAILASTYIIGSLAPAFLALASGDSVLVEGVLADLGRRLQRASRQRLETDLKSVTERLKDDGLDKVTLERERRRLMFELHERFPSADKEVLLAPTSLGSILNAGASVVWQRHRIAFSVLWPHMTPVLAADEPLLNRLQDQEARVHTFVNLAVVSGLVAIEALILRAAYRDWLAALGAAALGVALAALFYRASLGPARAWMATIVAAFDLHRDELSEKLKLRAAKSPASEREVWERTSQVLAYGGVLDKVLALGADAKSRFSVTSSDNIAAEVVSITRDDPPQQPFTGTRSWTFSYLVALSVKGKKLIGTGISPSGHVKITDEQLQSISDAPTPATGTTLRAQAQVLDEGESSALLWIVEGLTPGTVSYLNYRLPYCTVTASRDAVIDSAIVPKETGDYEFEIRNAAARKRNLRLVVWDVRLTNRRRIKVAIGDAEWADVRRNPLDNTFSIPVVLEGGGRTNVAFSSEEPR